MSTPAVAARARTRVRARVRGTVQGVGFRPYVFRLAAEHELGGFVLNDAEGVLVEVEGAAASVENFFALLRAQAPPLAAIDAVERQDIPARRQHAFSIRESPAGGGSHTPVTPDSATCSECLGELFDPADRRFRYPFINCTNCGPRFTIVRGVPYDRPLTTMAAFEMCVACRAEYEDPQNRRFHAQPNACPVCGPRVSLLPATGTDAPAGGSHADPVNEAAAALARGAIVAVKGVGGYHLACDASSENAVARLRARKRREERPFALMVATLAAADSLARVGSLERELLQAPERPIVLVPRRDLDASAIASSTAPGAPELGLMLPYTPLHHLLLSDFARRRGGVAALVMTSGNVSDEPIAFRDEDACVRLSAIADYLLLHDRPIETRTDDSVLRVVRTPAGHSSVFLRRSRGYVPASAPLSPPAPQPVLAVGAELKNTFCLACGSRAWVGHHIGDLENFETLRSFEEGIEHFKRLFDVQPRIVAHDLHPEYLSTKYALEHDGVHLEPVQHHHAHLAACVAEHAYEGIAVGVIFDGTGYGTDGTIWGGEILAGDAADFTRVGMLTPVPLPGGSAAIREPWRMACAWLLACDGRREIPEPPPALASAVDAERWSQVARLSRSPLAPLTSSIGRLFDAVAAIAGVRSEVNYEGQAAIELEGACDPGERRAYEIDVRERRPGDDGLAVVIDPRAAVSEAAADASAGIAVGAIASRFHAALASATVRACVLAASAARTDTAVLSGGAFANRRLLEACARGLAAEGLRVLIPERLPVGDGGISYGQAVVAARRAIMRAEGDGEVLA